MQPYTLHLKFYSPCIYYHPITLDAVISWCIAHEHLQADGLMGFYQKPGEVPDTYGLDRLDKVIKHIGGGYGVPCSSFMQPAHEPIEFLDSWKKRFENRFAHLADFGKAKRRIDTASGQYRSYNMLLPAKAISDCRFAFIGDGEEVVRLLRDNLVGVCKKVSEGFGWISDIELVEAEWTWQDVCRMRPFPLKFAKQEAYDLGIERPNMAICGWKPPYWLRRNIEACIVP